MDTAPSCPPGEALLMFLDGALPPDEQASVAVHLAGCQACHTALAFARDLSTAIRAAQETPVAPQEPCPSAWTLVQYSDGDLDEETARHVRAHLLWCEDCFAEVLALEHSGADAMPFDEALAQYLARWRTTQTARPLAAAGGTSPTLLAQVHGSVGTPERLDLEVLFGPVVSPEGRFALDLRVPDTPSCEGRAVLVRLRLDPYTFEMPSRVERSTISVDHALPGGYHGSASELGEALIAALEVHIL